MQIVPATGRRLARTLGIRGFTTSRLTNADTNIRMGTLYFSQLAQQFGGTHYALASYNAGESRVVRWKAERPGLDEDEFIDDIPFPETQNYVKRILGTAEDYRRLYGEAGGRPIPVTVAESSSEPAPTRTTARPRATRRPRRASPSRSRPPGAPDPRPSGIANHLVQRHIPICRYRPQVVHERSQSLFDLCRRGPNMSQ